MVEYRDRVRLDGDGRDSESSCTPGEGGYAARRRRLINGASRHLSSLGLLSGVSVSFAALLYGRLSVSQLPPKGRHWGHQQNTGVTAAPRPIGRFLLS